MIVRTHEFNSEWWGGKVGIVNLEKLKSCNDDQAVSEFQNFEWVELKLSEINEAPLERIHGLGFFYLDTQVGFRINLAKMEETQSLKGIHSVPASENIFHVEPPDIMEFSSDRFSRLPGCNQLITQQRYSIWSNKLIQSNPEYSLRIVSGGKTQGYFFAQDSKSGFDLTLAMLSVDSNISGLLLYHRALLTYRDMGKRVGRASFSVYNTPVLNIYSRFGAVFSGMETIWIRKGDLSRR